MYNYKLQITNH